MVGEIIEVNGQTYRMARKLDTFIQFHIARRIAPLLSGLAGAVQSASEDQELTLDFVLNGVAGALSKMSDQDVDYVIHHCFDVVQRKQNGETWARIQVDNKLMFQDIDMTVMLAITIAVIKENVGSFFSAPAASVPTGQPT